MSGGGKEVTVGWRYFLGMHLVLCKGPVDAVTQIKAGERLAWQGLQDASGVITIDQPGLFGGDEREGGVQGGLEILMGEATQGANAYLTSVQGGNQSGHRGVLSAVWHGGMVAANNPYLKPWAFRIRRITAGWKDDTPWYPETAPIPLGDEGTVAPWLTATDPRNPANVHQYRWTGVDAVWRGTLAEAIADAVADGRAIEAFDNLLGWSPDMVQLFAAYGLAPGDAATLYLHFNRYTVTHPTLGYVTVVTQVNSPFPLGGSFLGEFGAMGVSPGSGHFWWTGLTTTGYESSLDHAGLYRLRNNEPSDPQLPGEHFLNNFINYPASPISGLVPVGEASHDHTIEVRRATNSAVAMNPAHIVYACLTDNTWGMGYSASIVSDAAFRDAADIFFAEGLGLCLHWTQQEPIQNFVQIVLDHAGAMLSQEPTTGLLVLVPLRGDYTPSALPLFDEESIEAVEHYEKSAPPELINEITVRFDSLAKADTDSVKVQNLGNIVAQGGVVAKTVNYPGFPTAELAMRAGMRDLLAYQPLGRVRLLLNRSAYGLRPGGLIRWSWAKLGVTTMVLRVLKVDLGRLEEGLIAIEAVEDVFGVPSTTYAAQPASGWVPPNNLPAPAALRVVREATYLEVLRALGPSDAAELADDAGFVVAAAARPGADSVDFGMHTRVGTAAFKEQARGDFCPSGTLLADLAPAATSATLATLTDANLIEAGSYAQLGEEIVRIDSIDTGTGAVTLGRGVMGTVAQEHAAGARIYCVDGFLASDDTERVDAESVQVRLTPATGLGQLDLSGAPTDTVVLDQAFYRPYAPGRLRINGLAYPATVGVLAFTWAHRNRLQQNLEGDESGDIGPEAGTTYNAALIDPSDDSVVDSASAIAGTSWTASAVPPDGTYRFELEAERDSLASLHRHRYTFEFRDPFRIVVSLIPGAASGQIAAPGALLTVTAALLPGTAGSVVVLLLLHFDGTHGSTTFVDSGPNGETVTPTGATISTTQSVLGGASGFFSGSGQWLAVSGTAYATGTADFRVEFFLRIEGAGDHADQHVVQTRSGTGNGWVFIYNRTNKRLLFTTDVGLANLVTADNAIVDGTWHHIEVTREGNDWRLFLDSVEAGTNVSSQSLTASNLIVGKRYANDGANHWLNAYVDALLITSG